MTRRLSRRHLVFPAAALGAATLAFTVLAQPAPASSHQISSGHWDLVAEYDCATDDIIDVFAENHTSGATKTLANVTFVVNANNSVTPTGNDTGRFSSGPLRVLTDDATQAANGKLVLGFEAEYVNCSDPGPAVTFEEVSSSVPSGERAAAYENTSGTDTDIDTANGTNLNEGVDTSGHEDRRWGFTDDDVSDYAIDVLVTVDASLDSQTETVTFDVD